jgi:hypothetical protein
MRSEDKDPAYHQGWAEGRCALTRDVQTAIRKFKRSQAKLAQLQQEVAAILRDPEKLIEAAKSDPSIESALTVAFLTMVMVEGGVEPKDLGAS